MHTFIQKTVDMIQCPANEGTKEATNITIGDLHANFVKLLFFLKHEGICDVADDIYKRLLELYFISPQVISVTELDEFCTLLEDITIINTNTLVRLIGDELADRGNQDYFILKLLRHFIKQGVHFEILLSNHGLEFIEAYESFDEDELFVPKSGMFLLYDDLLNHSMNGLERLLERELISPIEVLRLIELYYKPSLKLISYTLDPHTPGIILYAHAPIGLEIIRGLAFRFEVPYEDHTLLHLAKTLDQINQAFDVYVKQNKIHELYHEDDFSNYIYAITWNRDYDILERPEQVNGYRIEYVHGHDSRDPQQMEPHIHNLDNLLGKSIRHMQGDYEILVADTLNLQQYQYVQSFPYDNLRYQLALLSQKKTNASLSKNTLALHASVRNTFYVYLFNEIREIQHQHLHLTCQHMLSTQGNLLKNKRSMQHILNLIAFIAHVGFLSHRKETQKKHAFFTRRTVSAQIKAILDEGNTLLLDTSHLWQIPQQPPTDHQDTTTECCLDAK